DLGVERGRILEDSLGRPAEAAASYRAAVQADPHHPAALLALLLVAARTGDRDGTEKALAGLAEAAAGSPERRAALSVELARFQRNAPGPSPDAAEARAGGGDPERALGTVRAALAAADPAAPPSTLLQELGELTRLRSAPRVQIDAIDELLRHLPSGATALEATLRREKAHLLRDV